MQEGRRKRYILRFLYESKLIEKKSGKVSLIEADFRGAKLDRIALPKTSLTGARFEGASLVNAKLEGTELISAHLEDTQLMDAKLRKAVLIRAHLVRANLTKADLRGANLIAANLEGAVLVKTELEGAEYVDDEESPYYTHWPRGFNPRSAGAAPTDFPRRYDEDSD